MSAEATDEQSLRYSSDQINGTEWWLHQNRNFGQLEARRRVIRIRQGRLAHSSLRLRNHADVSCATDYGAARQRSPTGGSAFFQSTFFVANFPGSALWTAFTMRSSLLVANLAGRS